MRLPALLAAALTASCAVPDPAPPDAPAAWRLIEVEARGGDSLVFDRYVPSGGPNAAGVRLSRDVAAVGEAVEADFVVPGDGRRWVELRPTRPGVRILGPSVFVADAGTNMIIRFTCDTAGRGGVTVYVRD
jgi:hypothetical protein